MIQALHTMDFSKNSRGVCLINDFDSHFCPCQNVSGHLLLDKGSLANGVVFVMANMGVLIGRDGCKVIRHGDVLTTLTILSMLTMLTNYANK